MTETNPENQDPTAPPRSFEEELAAMEASIQALESGQPTLEDAMRHYEAAVRSRQRCSDLLRRAQRRIEILCEELPQEDESGEEGSSAHSPVWKPMALRSLASETEDSSAADEESGEETTEE